MPIYRLGKEPMFPSPHLAEEDGLLAVGGKLNSDFIIEAYLSGIFPWFNSDEPILWWSPNPRSVIFIDEIHISKSMKKFIKNNTYFVSLDKSFGKVLRECGNTRKETWISNDIEKAYTDLYDKGIAHSVEVWKEEKLVGGLYGIALGKVFFGESMFSAEQNTSKLALIKLCKHLKEKGFEIVDCQIHNSHLESMGAREIPRDSFLKILDRDTRKKGIYGKWKFIK